MSIQELFRAEALTKLRNPEQLDTAFRLTTPIGWLSLIIIAGVLGAVGVWGFLGRLPDHVDGMGIILKEDSTVFRVVAPTVGRVSQISVQVGQTVASGDKIATLSLPDQETQQAGSLRTLADLREQHQHLMDVSNKEISERRANTAEKIDALQHKIEADRRRHEYLASLLASQSADLKVGYIKRDDLESTRNQVFQIEQSIRDSQNSIATARTEQLDFESQQYRMLADLQQRILAEQNKLESVKATIDNNKVVTAPVTGTVSEVSTKQGALVAMNDQIAIIEENGSALRLVGYVPVSKGKTVAAGMRVTVSPTSIDRNIYGSIKGKVIAVSSLSATKASLLSTFGDPNLVDQMMAPGPMIQLTIELDRDPSTKSGLAWTSSRGPPVAVTPGSEVTISVIVNEDRPVDLIVPIYETWLAGS
jgi:HlyD family secretion protein